jgi:hypothetical protein
VIFVSECVQFNNVLISYPCLTFIYYYYPYFLWSGLLASCVRFFEEFRKTFSSAKGSRGEMKLVSSAICINQPRRQVECIGHRQS